MDDCFSRNLRTYTATLSTPVVDEAVSVTTDALRKRPPDQDAALGDVRVVSAGRPRRRPPIVRSVRWVTLPHRPALVVVTFSEEMNRRRAEDLRNYRLASPERGTIPIGAVVYGLAPRSVFLFMRYSLDETKTYHLDVNGKAPNGLRSATGRRLDGQRSGRAGTDFSTLLSPRNRSKAALASEIPASASPSKGKLILPVNAPRVERPSDALAIDMALDSVASLLAARRAPAGNTGPSAAPPQGNA